MLLLSWVVGTFQYKGFERKSNGFFYLTTIGDFRPARNGDSRPTLTTLIALFGQVLFRTNLVLEMPTLLYTTGHKTKATAPPKF